MTRHPAISGRLQVHSLTAELLQPGWHEEHATVQVDQQLLV